ncbi:MAG: RDD family protein [Acidobacteria bacterium]|nr:RDD family protein [Acidobacteriota bacterium]
MADPKSEDAPAAREIAALFADALQGTWQSEAPRANESPFASPHTVERPEAGGADSAPPPRPRTRKIIEFPRPSGAFYTPVEELADPVGQAPRILEASPMMEEELLPLVPAITLDAAPEPAAAGAARLSMPVRPAPLARRTLAGVADLGLIATAVLLFGFVLLQVSPKAAFSLYRPAHNRTAVAAAAATVALLWAGYYFVFLILGRLTPGMSAAGLELHSVGGLSAGRRARGLRAAAMVISTLAAGMGLAWAWFDEDQLGWHDRMSGTYCSECGNHGPAAVRDAR